MLSEDAIDGAAADAVSPDGAVSEQVLRCAIAGDEACFAALYRGLQPRLRRYAASLVGDEAEDITSEAWLQIARDIRSFTGDLDAFRGWTARIVRNRALDHMRYRSRRPAELTLTPVLDLPEQPATDDPAKDVIDAMTTKAALALIMGLPRDQAEAVLLRAVVGLDARTAGDVLNKSSAAVRVAAHRGLKRLAKRLAASGGALTPSSGGED
jgi:RNA polymerase sigma-70 factor (ECF subfamily)